MKGVTMHGALLGVMLILAYQAWTPDETNRATLNSDGDYTVWDVPSDQVTTLTFVRRNTTTVIERREEAGEVYLWGRSFESLPDDTAQDTTAAADSVPARRTPAPAQEFPVGDEGEDIWNRVAHLRALRDLGALDDAGRERYELNDTERRLTISTSSGERLMEIGGTVYGSIHRYAVEPATGKGYVLADQIVRALEGGQSSLRQQTLHRFGQDEIGGVTVRGPSGERTMTRNPGPTRQDDLWVSPDTPDDPDQTFQTFMNHVRQLAMLNYQATVNTDTLQFLVRIDYRDEDNQPMGFLELYRAPSSEPDVWEYYLRTQSTRIPAHAHRNLAERVDRDLADVF
jgi:hypothetical protein